MDTPRSPGVGPLTWATLRLLTFSWLVLGVLTVWNSIRPPREGLLICSSSAGSGCS
jgi:hypothetical protein